MILGVSGKAGAGKDWFCDIAVEKFGAIKTSFAAGLKEEVSLFLNECSVKFHKNNLYGSQEMKEMKFSIVNVDAVIMRFPEFESYVNKFCERDSWFINNITGTFRSLLQWWGTEYRRAQDDQYWVKKCLTKCTDLDSVYVISDMRFKNEAQAIRDAGGILIRIERPNGVEISNMAHPSEIDLDNWEDWDVEINNNSTLEVYTWTSESILKDIIDDEF